jgi:replicative DNA helicase
MDFLGLDNVINLFNNLQGGNLVLIGSLPSLGKTKLALSLVNELSINRNIGVCFFSLEFSKEKLEKRAFDMDFNINNKNLQIIDNANLNITELKDVLKKKVKDTSVKYCFIDYLGLMASVANDKKQNIIEITKILKSIASELNITVVGLIQASKEYNGLKPEINHFISLENIVDIIIALHKNTERKETEIIILKNNS